MTEANNLMKLKEYSDALHYRVGCDCSASEHDLDIWVETEEENHFPAIYFSGTLHTELWGEWFDNRLFSWLNAPLNRISIALRVLFTGKVEMHREFMLGKENIAGLRLALDEIEKKFQ
jgi:hypothetical protein